MKKPICLASDSMMQLSTSCIDELNGHFGLLSIRPANRGAPVITKNTSGNNEDTIRNNYPVIDKIVIHTPYGLFKKPQLSIRRHFLI